MPSARDLTAYPQLDAGAYWFGMPAQETSHTPAWFWVPGDKPTHDGTLHVINQLVEAGWERLGGERWNSQQMDSERYLRLMSQLADVHLLELPGLNDSELWVRTADIRRAESLPVTLAFARMGVSFDDIPGAVTVSPMGFMRLNVAEMLPPPQFGEIALVDHKVDGQHVWQVYTLAELGEAGLALWQRMGTALKALAAPGEWWPLTPRLEACLTGDYARLREAGRSELLTTRGQAREVVRERLALLELDNKHAKARHTARERAGQDPAAWVERWQEVRDMAAELAALYWEAHQRATSIPSTAEEAEAEVTPTLTAEAIPIPEEAIMIADLVIESVATSMDTPSYQEDRAVREALLAAKDEWQVEEGVPRFRASNDFGVYFLDPKHPLSLADAQAQLLRITPRTLITTRIAMSLWNLRRHDAKLGRNGQALITHDEILHWRGVPKHSRLLHPGTDSKDRVTDGWRSEDREAVRRDFELASRYYLRGQHTIVLKDKRRSITVDGPYVHVSFISIEDEPRGVWLGPGGWINDYEDAGNYYLAEIDRRIFQLQPSHEQHELLIALYLAERWRTQAHNGHYDEPITMTNLLQSSVIPVDRKHLERFASRVEQALEILRKRGIIGKCECLTPPDRTKRNWGKDWLAARWRIQPPDDLQQSYTEKGITKDTRQLPPGPAKEGRKPTRKG